MTLAVLGCDPSLRGLGYALARQGLPVFDGWQPSDVVGDDSRARVLRYRQLVEPVVEAARQYKPRVVVIEGYAFSQHAGRGVVDRAELGGILRDRLERHCEIVLEIAPTTVKLFATGRGGGGALPKGLTAVQRSQQLAQRRRDSKGAVARGLADLYGVSFRGDGADDRADAFALAMIGACLVGIDEPRTEAQRRVVDALRAKAVAA